jgi:thioredoxin 1
VEFFKLDIDADMDIAMNNQIVSIPTLLIFKGGEKVGQIVGYMEEAELKANIEKALQ